MHFSTKLGGGGCKTRAGTDKNNNKALLWATKPLVVHIICHFCFFSHSVVFPSSPLNLSSSLVLLPHGSSHLPLPPPHSLQRLCSDSYVWVERGLLLICAEWEKAVLARRKKKKPSLACTVGWMEGWMNGWINGLICHSNTNTLGFYSLPFSNVTCIRAPADAQIDIHFREKVVLKDSSAGRYLLLLKTI